MTLTCGRCWTSCYDEQDPVTWAGSTGTPSCTGTGITSGTLSSAQYSQSFGYDNLSRLTSGPQGSCTYGPGQQATSNPAPLHAALTIGSSYTASYDAAGNMTCRSASSNTTCAQLVLCPRCRELVTHGEEL